MLDIGRKTAVLACISSGLLSLAALPATAGDLRPFSGKYVFDKVKGKALFEVPEVKKGIVELVGEKRYKSLIKHRVSDGVKPYSDPELGELLVSWQCQPHNCPFASVVVLTMNGSVLGICFEDEVSVKGDSKTVEWAGKGWQKKKTGALSCFGEGAHKFEAEKAVKAFKAAGK
jgi:hypothetical protein